MTAALTIVRAMAKRLQGERRLPFFVIALPILIMLLVGTIFGTGQRRLVVGVVAPDGDPAAATLVSAMRRSPVLKPRHFDRTGSARRAVRRGRITAAIVVPDAYAAGVRAGQTTGVRVIVQPGRADSFEARVAIGAVLARVNVDLVAMMQGRAAPANVADPFADDDDRESPFAYTAPSNLVLFAFITALVTSAAVVEARRSGVTRRILASPTAAGSVIAGELVAAFLTSLFQATLMLGIGAVFFGVDFGSIPGVVLLVLAVALVSGASGSLLATFARTPEQSISFGPPIGIAMGMLGGCMWPLDGVGPALRAFGHLTPHAWAMDGFIKLIFGESGLAGIAPQLAVVLAMAIGLLVIATTRLRRAILVP